MFASAFLVAPVHSLVETATILSLAGLYGVVHLLGVVFRARRATTHVPTTPRTVTIAGSAIALPLAPAGALCPLSAGVLLLIFIGIRNAWDPGTFIVLGGADHPATTSQDIDE